jgi:hypothetical protein
LIRLGLVDEFRLFVHPVILSGGKPFFPALEDRIGLTLLGTRTFDSFCVPMPMLHCLALSRPSPTVDRARPGGCSNPAKRQPTGSPPSTSRLWRRFTK